MVKSLCPVCQTELIQTYKDYQKGTVLEEYIECPNHCYTYKYAYGNSEEYIGDFILGWNWYQRVHWTYLTYRKRRNLAIRITKAKLQYGFALDTPSDIFLDWLEEKGVEKQWSYATIRRLLPTLR